MKLNTFAHRVPVIFFIILLVLGSIIAIFAAVQPAGAILVYDCSDTSNTTMNLADCQALVALHTEAGGPGWTDSASNNWLVPGTDPCADWAGVTCSTGRVTQLVLQSNNLTGDFPTSLLALTELTILSLGDNALTGPIPTEISQLSALTGLWLSKNSFEDTIPTQIANLSNLGALYLNGNMFTGIVPQGLCNLSLTNMLVGHNMLDVNAPESADCVSDDDLLTQTVPPDPFIDGITTNASNSDSITVSWVPIDFAGADGRYEVYKSTVSGVFGSEIAGHTSDKNGDHATITGLDPDTEYFFVVRTQSISSDNNKNTLLSEPSAEVSATPTAISLADFQVSDGSLLPTILGAAAVLLLIGTVVYLLLRKRISPITGILAVGFILMLFALSPVISAAPDIYPAWCQSNPPLDVSAAECQSLSDLYLSTDGGSSWLEKTNWLESTSVCTWHGVDCDTSGTQVTSLDLAGNNLSGPIPDSLADLTGLSYLDLGYNKLTGPVPESLTSLTALTVFYLDGNQLEGLVPQTVCDMSAPSFALEYNKLEFTPLCASDHPSWAYTQTVPPEGLEVTSTTVTTIPGTTDTTASVDLQWNAIPYVENGGGYEVFARNVPAGTDGEQVTMVDDKGSNSTSVTVPGDPMDFAFYIKTHTDSHPRNPTSLVSKESTEDSLGAVAIRLLDIEANTPLLYIPALAPILLLLATLAGIFILWRRKRTAG